MLTCESHKVSRISSIKQGFSANSNKTGSEILDKPEVRFPINRKKDFKHQSYRNDFKMIKLFYEAIFFLKCAFVSLSVNPA